MFPYQRLMRVFLPAAIVAGSLASASPAAAASIAVTTIAPSPGGSSDCTLGEAIQAANSDAPVDGCAAGSGSDVISIPSGTYTLSSVDHISEDGPVALPDFESTITLDGANSQDTIIQRDPTGGTPSFMLLHMNVSTDNQCWPSCTLTVRDLTLQNAVGLGGAITNVAGHTVIDNTTLAANTSGPAVRTTGPLTVKDSVATNNSSTGDGGVFKSEGKATVTGSDFSSNSAGTGGVLFFGAGSTATVSGSDFNTNSATTGGVLAGNGTLRVAGSSFSTNSSLGGSGGAIGGVSGTVQVTNSSFSYNSAGGTEGGAIDADGPLEVTGSTFEENTSDTGGAISARGTSTTIKNSTFAANGANVVGGGVFASGGTATISNSTFAGNFGASGGGLGWDQNGGTLALRNSLLATNNGFESPDCASATEIVSNGYNLVGDATGCSLTPGSGDQLGTSEVPVDPLLGSLDYYGAERKTYSLTTGSPAIDSGNPATPGGGGDSCEQFDQRGQARPRDGDGDETFRCDIGAYEGGIGLPLLTTEKDGTGTGLIETASAGAIVCGADCAETYASGTTVVLVATPTTDSEFTQWTGCDSVVGDQCTVSMNNDRTVTATFTDVQSVLSVTRTGAGQGSVSSVPAGIDCGHDCSELYANGTTVTLTATPASNSNFHFWSGCDSTSGTSCTFTLGEDRDVFASFSPIVRTLTLNKSGTGSGTVTSSPEGIDCGNDCGEAYQIGTDVTLTAVVGANSEFGGWAGCDSSVGLTCNVTVNNHQAVAATFTPIQRLLSVTKAGTADGTIASSPARIDCPGTCSANFDDGASVTLTATPAANAEVSGWTGCDSVTGNECIVQMDAVKDVTTTFSPSQRAVNVTKVGNGTGTVTSAPAGISCGSDCSQSYDHNTTVTLTAAEGANSVFRSWSGCDSTDALTCTVLANGGEEISATFDLIQRPLSVTTTGSGTGAVSSAPVGIDCGADCSQDYDHGTSVTLTATPDANVDFGGWTGCDAVVGQECTVTMSSAKDVVASFTPTQRALGVTTTGTGSGSVSSSPVGIDCGFDCTQNYDHGTSVVLTAAPASGSAFESWTGCDSTAGEKCTVAMTAAKDVVAGFTTDPRTLSVSKSGTGTGSLASAPTGIDCGSTCSAAFDVERSVTLTATPGPNSEFTSWTGCPSPAGNQCTVTMIADRAVGAEFSLVKRSLTVDVGRVAGDSVAAGSVTSDVGTIDCAAPAECSDPFTHGTDVVLTATPGAGNEFSGWTGCDVATGNTCTMTMDAAKTVRAEFHNTTLPSSSVTPAPGATNSPTIDIGYEAAAGAGLSLTAVELWLDGPGEGGFVKVADAPSPATSGTFEGVALDQGDGAYEVKTRARNNAGNYENGTPFGFTLDTSTPGSTVSAPATANQNAFSLSWSSDQPVNKVELWVDGPGAAGPVLARTAAASGNAGTFDFSITEGSGAYSFYSVAEDAASNREDAPLVADAVVNVTLCPGYEDDARVHLVGDAGNNKLIGTGAAEVICGEGGNDTISGRGGRDLMVGGAGRDTVTYAERSAKQAVTVTVNKGANDGKAREGDEVGAGIENVIGGKGNDIITGHGGANLIKGGVGNDTLKGGGGKDKLYGEKGKDKLDGGGQRDVCKTGEVYTSCEVR